MTLAMANFGCGSTFHLDWQNYDLVPTHASIRQFDLANPLPITDASLDAFYSSHVLEHLTREQANRFLSEAHRVLKPKGTIRIVVPDLEQIASEYLANLQAAISGDNEGMARYEWSIIELLDQLVRIFPGGEMGRYWKQTPMPAEEYVFSRVGSEAKSYIENQRQKNDVGPLPPCPKPSAEQITSFRTKGEIHQWMYDRYSLGKLLEKIGFSDVHVMKADQSRILNFNSFCLDIDSSGATRKPDSLFIEGVKKV